MDKTGNPALDTIRERVESGLYLSAWEAAQALGPMRSWAGTEARLLAGRLAMALGAPRLGLSLHLRAHRKDPEHPEALYYRARATFMSRGPLGALQFMDPITLPETASAEVRADWLALRGTVATRFRDFGSAERQLAEAERVCPHRPWSAVERAALLEEQDRLEEALEAARRQLHEERGFRPGVGMAARLLERLGRFEEAVALLQSADQRLECASLAGQLAPTLLDLGRPAEAIAALDRFLTLSPLLEPGGRAWVAGCRSDAAYATGDCEAAARYAREAKNPFHDLIAQRLGEPEDVASSPRRVLLPVPFIQQEHMTCSPTALSSVTAYWGRPVDHVALAREIAYDGTPGHREREWVASHGFKVREFRLTREAARALLDRGVPFTIATQHPTSAHTQTVIGYDARRGTLSIRDPAGPRLGETLLDGLVASQALHGPRCLAIVPDDREDPLAGLELPDEAAYDAQHRVELMLLRHDRAGAQAIRDELDGQQPGHRLVHLIDARLAGYDSDLPRLLGCYERLLEAKGDDPMFGLRRINLLLELGRHEEGRAALEPLAHDLHADPAFAARLADLLATDARRQDEALRLLHRALRARATDSGALSSLADLRWRQGRHEEGLVLYRLAACTEIHNEGTVGAYVSAARHLGRAEEALAFLRERVAQLGDRSSAPARSLFRGLENLGRTDEALACLREALERHPEDGNLLLFAAEAEGRYGGLERAWALLAASAGRARETDRWRAEARLRGWSGDLAESLGAWRRVAESEPLSLEAHRAVASLLDRLETRQAALAHLRGALERVPTHRGLHRLLVEWQHDSPEASERELLELLRRHPDDAWAHRELALGLAEAQRFEAAETAVEQAALLEPQAASTFGVRGLVRLRSGRADQAVEAFRAAVSRAADYDAAIGGWLDAVAGREAQAGVLRFLGEELLRQTAGDGFFCYQRRARVALEPGERRSFLTRAQAERPEIWQTWSALADELSEQGELESAARLLEEATQRFPLVAPLWLDRARAAHRRDRPDEEQQGLEAAVAMSPGWIVPLEALAEALVRRGHAQHAVSVFRRAAALDPTHARLTCRLAEILASIGQHDEAISLARRTLALDPGQAPGWALLSDLAGAEEALALARRLADERPESPDALLALVRALGKPETLAERLELLDRVTALRPRLAEAHDLRAVVLTEAGRFDAALQACSPRGLEGTAPLTLRGRRAWVLARAGRRAQAMTAMRQVVDEHPDYWWGARMLADWAAEDGTPGEALAAAEHLLRLAPQDALALGYRGAARLRAGQVEEGCGDLEHALVLDPADEFAATRLFDALIDQARVDDAAELLDRVEPHLTEEQRNGRRARLMCARGDVVRARERIGLELSSGRVPSRALRAALFRFHQAFGGTGLRQALADSLAAVHPEAAQTAIEVLVECGDRDGAKAALDGLTGRPEVEACACRGWLSVSAERAGDREVAERLRELDPQDPEVLVLLARTIEANEPSAALALYEETLRLAPDHIEARDMRAAHLAGLGRWDEARAACREREGEDAVPMPLRSRAAWIEAKAGNAALARRRMRAVVEQDPFMEWAWDRLLEWDFQETAEIGSYLKDARRYAEVFPGQPPAHGYLADALRRFGRRAEAEVAFRRSLQLDPGYAFGRIGLIDLLLESGRSSEAHSLLEVKEAFPALRLRAVRVALADRHAPEAAAAFEALLRDDASDDDTRRAARRAITEAGASHVLERVFEGCVQGHNPPDTAATLWIEWLGERGDWRGCERLLKRLDHPRLRQAALAGHIRTLRANDGRRLKRFVRRQRKALRQDDFVWGLAGHALSAVDKRAAVRFMDDWPKRQVPPFVLTALVSSLRSLGRAAEAVAVSARALEMPPDHATDCHRIWLGIEAAIEGRCQEAERHFEGVHPPEDGQVFFMGLVTLGRAVLRMQRADRNSRATAFAEARRLVKEVDSKLNRRSPAFAPLRRRALARIAKARGGLAGWWWGFVNA